MGPSFSRRDFSRVVAQSLALAASAPYLRAAQGGRHDQPAPEGAIHLNFNESPYGPSPKGARSTHVLRHTWPRAIPTAHT